MTKTSWQRVSSWYDERIGNKGDDTHTSIILPKTLTLLHLQPTDVVLDLGCGQGVLARTIPQTIRYTGLDIAPSLIEAAKNRDRNPLHTFAVHDITQPFHASVPYTHVVSLLTLDNLQFPQNAIRLASDALTKNGVFLFVINHPCFRIPRQSSWGIDEKNKIQYRRINRYLSPLEIPITMHPGASSSLVTWTYHFSVGAYSQWLHEAGFMIEVIEEWTSDKTSVGKAGKMENRSRNEFPLFLTVQCRKPS